MSVQVSSSELAKQLGVSAGRVSQYVSEGKLEGCFQGDGRARRFDLERVAAALGKRLDPGQMMGNGAGTRRAIRSLLADDEAAEDIAPPQMPPARHPAGAQVLKPTDPDGYEMARTDLVQQQARKARRDNLLMEGRYVLASEVERNVRQVLAGELRAVETVLRNAARKVADRLGVDALAVRQILIDAWRAHRAERAGALDAAAEGVQMTAQEIAADV